MFNFLEGTFLPYGTNIMIRADELTNVSESGIIIPETAKRERSSRTGTIVNLGDKWNDETGDDLQIGDKVLFLVLGSTQTENEHGETIFFVRDTHHPRAILAKLSDD